MRRRITNASGSSDSTNDSSSGTTVGMDVIDANRLLLLVDGRPFLDVSNEKVDDVLRFPDCPTRVEGRRDEFKNRGGGGVGEGSIPNRPELLKLLTAPVGLSKRVILLKLSAKEEPDCLWVRV